MRIRYAVSTMVFWWREHSLSFEQECEFLKHLGFGVELWPSIKGHNECRYERRNWPRLAAATKDMVVAMRSRNDQPTLEQWAEQIECAKLLKAGIVVDLQSLQATPDGSSEFAGEVVKMAEENDVRLCVETGPLPTLKKLGEEFDSLRFCLDTGYVNTDTRFDFKRYVDELGERVTHLHLNDNSGSNDDHEPPGTAGGISRKDWDYLLRTLNKYDNEVIGSFEMCPSTPDAMIRQACDFLFDVLKWPNPPEKRHGSSELIYSPQ